MGAFITNNANAMSFAEFVYTQAKNNNLSTIKTYLSKGYPIDATDTDGNTALCYAIEYKDFNAYKNIKTLVATGGYSTKVIPHTKSNILIDENLILDGLCILYNKNHKK